MTDQPTTPEPPDAATIDAEAEADPTHLTLEEQEELFEAEPGQVTVTYSGQDFDIHGLVRRMDSEDILIPTFGHEDERIEAAGFQRSFVWTKPQMDRFIESLFLGYPIPGIFLVRQTDRRYLVLDGQQRLRTLQFFYEGMYAGRTFSLRNVDEAFVGLTYKVLTDEQRRRLDDTFLQATIVESDGSDASLDAIYKIFERLNSGGTQLTPHEIRVALYAGEFIDYLESLNSNQDWRALYGKRSPRLRDQELVLRIVSLYTSANNYQRPLKSFLNSVVSVNRRLQSLDSLNVKRRFLEASKLINDASGRSAMRLQGYQVNAAMAEALFVGVMRRLDHGTALDASQVKAVLGRLRQNNTLSEAVSRATADEERVRTRLEIATAAFAKA